MPENILTQEMRSYGEEAAANFNVSEIMPLFDVQSPEAMIAIEMKVHAPDKVYQVTADISSSITRQILEAVPSSRLFGKNMAGVLDAYLIEQAARTGGKRVLCREFGLQRLYTGNWIFAAGDEILGDCGAADVVIHPSVARKRLAWDRDGDERKAVVRTLHAMVHNEWTVWPTFMYTLLSSLRSQVFRLGITTFPVLYLVGQQNSGKSWLVEHYSLLYDDTLTGTMYGNLDASSTDKGVIHAVSSFKDAVVAVDDLPKSGSSAVQRERLEVMEKSIRFIANGSTRTTALRNSAATPLCCQSGAVCTGEIPLETASMLTRLLEVPLTRHEKNGGMSDRADAATAFRRWMLWLLPRLDAELEALKKLLAENCGGENERLESTNILSRWTAELFYRFAWKEDFIEERYYREIVDQAQEAFGSLLAAQAAKVDKIQDAVPLGNLSYYILKGYRKDAFHVVSSRKKIKSNSDCLVEKGALCIRTEALLNYLRGEANFQNLTEKHMTKQLREEGVLPDTQEKRATSKKIKGKSYLELCFSALKEASQRY